MNKMQRDYPLIVWLTTLVAGSVMVVSGDPNEHKPVGTFFLVLLVSIVLSLPAFLLNILICRKIARTHLKTKQAQAVIALIGIGLIGITFGIIILYQDRSEIDSLTKTMVAGCSVSSVIAAFVF